MGKKKKRVARCWQCKSELVKGICPKNCGPKALGDLFRLGR